MNGQALQITKREMHGIVTSRTAWIAMLATGVILGLAAPFGTGDALGTPPRVLYWIVTCASGCLLGSAVANLAAETPGPHLSRWPAVVIGGALAGIANLVALLALNWAVFGLHPGEPGHLAVPAPDVVIIAVIVSVALAAINDHLAPAAADAPAVAGPPRILDRLPRDKRGALTAPSVQDHSVEIHTRQGTGLVLMRLGDAMAEVGGAPGLKVHRSHWVATDAVASVCRGGARAVRTLHAVSDVPVSRTYFPAIKEAGLLPR